MQKAKGSFVLPNTPTSPTPNPQLIRSSQLITEDCILL
ncbi:hypothetical protein MYAER_1574 [Microcystis aeruginosa NIES-2549]|uniref:Uncharacterized protein n=1 Tax=Microcystis aeruginosa NIES-2549 TaxID=1641812 RepID=A0A0F6U3L1_MICAE|nr:hypothetical protein MYAER_1574 [Microcystis aeruginosa NIES-2549]AOC52316.1 hypothetical protein amyaer_1589 [Microcystis aeruginosa NIES-2481]